MFDYANTTVLVTGASSGLGETFAVMLAGRGANLVLVARNASKLEALAATLRATHNVEATVIAADLADSSAPAKIHAEAKTRGLPVNLLVNNAGFALAGAFLGHDLKPEEDQIAVNLTTPTALSHLFGADMRAFGRELRDQGTHVLAVGPGPARPSSWTKRPGTAWSRRHRNSPYPFAMGAAKIGSRANSTSSV